MTGSAPPRPTRAALFLLVGLVILSTGRSLGNGFAFDDVPIIAENTQVQHLAAPWTYAQQSYWPPDNLGDAYRPWTIWWFGLQWAMGAGAPWIFHLGNLLLTIGVTLAVWLAGLEVMGPVGAITGAALFAVHPVHVEATGNVVGQAELWMALFSVLAVWIYLRARRTDRLGIGTRLILALLLVLAAASKEQGIVLPGLLVLAEWLRPGSDRFDRRSMTTFAVLAVTGVAFLAGRFAVLGDLGGGPPAAGLAGLGLMGRLEVMLPIVVDWARLLVWPARLSAQYSPPAAGGTHPGLAVLGAVILIGAVVVAALARNRSWVIPFGILWTGLALLPVSNIPFPTGVLIAERTLLLPSVGLALVAGCLADRARGRAIWLVGGVTALLAGLGAARSFARQAVWRDNPTLFAQTVRDEPGGYRGYFVSGRDLVRRGATDSAATMYRRAAELYAGDYRVFEEWGQILRTRNRCDLAIPIFQRGLAAYPDGTVVRSRLFECLLTEKRIDEASAVAEAGVARGLTEFRQSLARAERARVPRR